MKRNLKRLQMEYQETKDNITYLVKEINEALELKLRIKLSGLQTKLTVQQKKLKRVEQDVKDYGKGTPIYQVEIARPYKPHILVYYTNVEPEEVGLLIQRDFNGLDYKVLEKKTIISGEKPE